MCLVIVLFLTSTFHFWQKYQLIGAHERYWQELMTIRMNKIYLIYVQVLYIQQNALY